MDQRGTYRIGALRVAAEAREVRLGEKKIGLPWRCFEALLVLMEADGQVVGRETFFQRLWPNETVEESNLNQAIARLRKELSEAGDIIETVPRRGYRLLVRPELEREEDQASTPIPRTAVLSRRSRLRWVAAVAAVAVLAMVVVFAWPAWWKRRQARELVEEGFRLVRENRSIPVGESTALFSRALQLDPKLALGYAGLAEAMARSVEGSRIHARAMAERSLELDPGCAECRGITGMILLTYSWQFADANRHLQAAAKAKPDDPRILLWNAQAAASSGKLDESLRAIEWAVVLNPTDAGTQSMEAGILYFLKRYDESITKGRLALGLRAAYTGAYDWVHRSAMASGRIDEALGARAALIASFNGMSYEARQEYERRWMAAYRSGGMAQLVRELLKDSEAPQARKQQVYDRASLRMWAGDREGALEELEDIFEFHPYHCIYLGVDAVFDAVRQDERFRRILARMGLDQVLAARQ